MSPNFPGYLGAGVAVAVTSASAVTQIATTPEATAAEDMLIDNRGTVDVYVRAGLPTGLAATVNCVRIPAGAIVPLAKGANNTHLAAICASGTGSLVVHCGEGQ